MGHRTIDGIAALLTPDDPLSARPRALSAYAMTAGTPQLSPALADQRLADTAAPMTTSPLATRQLTI
ncbi:hypothetical protein [Streptomyces sp. SLBN-115]|uniref:hypothetical protein n=1 Tax=Streptomyces sp. SLBN-115 TaxID=2768453 RepID=UPI001154AF96|nr:hypothetical protein [Streptomyces sp. SLBN-115]